MLNISLYLIKKNLQTKNLGLRSLIKKEILSSPNFKSFLIDKSYLEYSESYSGLICLYRDNPKPVAWANMVNTLAKKREKIVEEEVSRIKGVVLLKVAGRVAVLSFSNGVTMIDNDLLESDFGIKTARKLLDIQELRGLHVVSLSEATISNKKYSKKSLPLYEHIQHKGMSYVKDLEGTFIPQSTRLRQAISSVSIKGHGHISLAIKENTDSLRHIVDIVKYLSNVYSDENQEEIRWKNEITPVTEKEVLEDLEEGLVDKLKEMAKEVEKNMMVSARHLKYISFSPMLPEKVEEDDIRGYYVRGLGALNNKLFSDINDHLIFAELCRYINEKNPTTEQLIRKLKSNSFEYVVEGEEREFLATLYNSLYFKMSLKKGSKARYILHSGKWYEVPKDFVDEMVRRINAIDDQVEDITFGRLDSSIHSGEGGYNEDLAIKTDSVLFDQVTYRLDDELTARYNLSTKGFMEPCDVLSVKENEIRFIHVKRGSSGSGISHLMTQALTSATLYHHKDPGFFDHINNVMVENQRDRIDFGDRELKPVIVLACTVKLHREKEKNSHLFPLLTMVTITDTVKRLEGMGFECKLVKIPEI